MSQVKVGSFCFNTPVGRDGCGDLLVRTDCVRRWYWSAFLCVTAVFVSTFSSHVLKKLDEFLEKTVFYTFFCSGPQIKHSELRKSRWSRVGTSKIILDFYPVICLVRRIMFRIGKVGKEVVKKLDYQ